jgi:hypothetical protein
MMPSTRGFYFGRHLLFGHFSSRQSNLHRGTSGSDIQHDRWNFWRFSWMQQPRKCLLGETVPP